MKSYDTNSHSSDVAISCKASDRHLHLKNRNPDPSRGLRYIPPRTFDRRTRLRLGQDMIRNSTVTPSTRRRLATRLQRQLRYPSIDAVDAAQPQTSEDAHTPCCSSSAAVPSLPETVRGRQLLEGGLLHFGRHRGVCWRSSAAQMVSVQIHINPASAVSYNPINHIKEHRRLQRPRNDAVSIRCMRTRSAACVRETPEVPHCRMRLTEILFW